MVEQGRSGILQSGLWKALNLTSRDGSRLALRLEKRGMVRREKVLDEGRWTYKLTPARLPVQVKAIEDAPCLTCPVENQCSVVGTISSSSCTLISDWVLTEFRAVNNPIQSQNRTDQLTT
ncbi:MAG: transcriptional regulator [Thaumarchaeota archaeon]|nr:transcriptional regulator [Nitrososphaerota archaeon]